MYPEVLGRDEAAGIAAQGRGTSGRAAAAAERPASHSATPTKVTLESLSSANSALTFLPGQPRRRYQINELLYAPTRRPPTVRSARGAGSAARGGRAQGKRRSQARPAIARFVGTPSLCLPPGRQRPSALLRQGGAPRLPTGCPRNAPRGAARGARGPGPRRTDSTRACRCRQRCLRPGSSGGSAAHGGARSVGAGEEEREREAHPISRGGSADTRAWERGGARGRERRAPGGQSRILGEGGGKEITCTILPSLSSRNFSKFHAMSERATGVHSVTVVPPKPPRGSTSASASAQPLDMVSTRQLSSLPPVGIMISDFIHLKIGCASAPLTSPFSKTVTVEAGSKPPPGRTCFSVLRNSSLPSLVWCPNCEARRRGTGHTRALACGGDTHATGIPLWQPILAAGPAGLCAPGCRGRPGCSACRRTSPPGHSSQ